MMHNDEEHSILEFLKQKALRGHFDNTTREIAEGTNLGYNQVARVLERLTTKDEVRYRERGTARKSVRYYYLRVLAELCQQKWKMQDR